MPGVLALIPESTRKEPGGERGLPPVDGVGAALPSGPRQRLQSLRDEVEEEWEDAPREPPLLPAYRRFQGNMYRRIPREAWEDRAPDVEVLIVSGLLGLVASRDTVPPYPHSMAESRPPFRTLNRWWREAGLPEILQAYVKEARPEVVVDLLSQAYRKAVTGYAEGLGAIRVETVDFPGMGRGSQPRRGEQVAHILQTGRP